MYRGLRIHILMALVLALVLSASVQAQAYGRVTVFVKNAQGEPLQGVKVSVTCKDLDKYREEVTTNKKGKATVSFTDATRFYDFHFEYEDFQPQDMTIKPQIRTSITREIVLTEGQVVAVSEEGGAESRVIFSPAERVFNEGVAVLQTGDLAGAKAKFLESLEKNDKMAATHSALAGIYIEEKDYQAALASANTFRELAPEDPNGLFMLYDIYTALGNQEDANAALETLKKMDKGGDTVALIYNAGVAAVKAGNYAGAKARFEEALGLDPTLKEAMGALSVIYATQNDYAKAAAWAEKHLAIEPGHARSLRIRWDAYRELGEDEAKTKAAFQELAAADPKVLITEFYNTGNQLFESGDAAAASEKFRQILEIDPEYARAHYRLGVCLVSTGDSAGAKEHLEKFIELAPDDPEVATAKDMITYLD